MIKVITPWRTDSDGKYVNEQIEHSDAVSMFIDTTRQLICKNEKLDTVAVYAAGEWLRAVKS